MRYELIDQNNLILATRVQLEIFPDEIAYCAYKKSIEDEHKNYRYYLVYKESVIIGITGLYIEDRYSDSIWIGWYGVLENYRLHGFGEKILLDTFNMAKEWALEKGNISYIRLYTSYRDNPIAQILYKKYMTTVENYNNTSDINFDNTCLIYSRTINESENVELWNNRFLNLKYGDEMIVDGFKEFIKLTNGDIHIQIASTGEVF